MIGSQFEVDQPYTKVSSANPNTTYTRYLRDNGGEWSVEEHISHKAGINHVYGPWKGGRAEAIARYTMNSLNQ